MKKIVLTLFIFSSLFSSAQNPLVKMWDKRFGGDTNDWFTSFQQTTDGGYILGGYSSSGIGGDKTQAAWGLVDYWIVKTDSLGTKQWDKDFGGTYEDRLNSVQQTLDGGYILGGYSGSGIGGDKTQAAWGLQDYWIVKTDSLGNKQWDKDFGGTDLDYLYSIQQTADGGYILGGCSWSGIGGDKTQALRGVCDYWIIKADSLGNKQWDKDFGGIYEDDLFAIKQTVDGGYILGGYSWSGIGGDKTQALWGACDYWIVKTDSLGNKQWDKDFGGADVDYLYYIQQTADRGYILGGDSWSGVGGDKTQATWGIFDYWIVKTDSLGNKEWDKDFGGTNTEELNRVTQTTDDGYLISGDSYSTMISGNKTESNFGVEQTWVVKTDSLGNMQWDKTILSPGHDDFGLAIQTSDACYTFVNSSNGGIGGYKTQAEWNSSWDYWIIKFCDSTFNANFISTRFICPGTCTDFLNLSINALTYQWNFFGASPDTSTAVNPQSICYANPGSYDVQLIATNANGSDTLLLTNYITVYPTPPPQGIIQNGDTLFANAGAGTYQWYFNGNIINGATDYFYVAPASGDYNVVCTDENGCEVEAAVFNVVAGVDAMQGQEVIIFPNPAEEFVVVSSEFVATATNVSIFNMLGEKVLAAPLPTPNSPLPTELDVRALPSGMYWLEITSGEKIYRSKFIKQ